MKKIALMMALVVVGNAVSAQSLNVSSALEALKRGYLDKAKKLIDPACEHEQTKNDAKTWYYAALIYGQIGGEQDKAKSKYKNLDPDWLTKCKDAALHCRDLDVDKDYATDNNNTMSFVGNEYYKKAIEVFNTQEWDKCMELCEESIKMFMASGKREYANESYLLAGRAAVNAQNNDAVKKYFKPLVRSKTQKNIVYSTLFRLYKQEADTNEAIKLAQNYVKFCPEDFNANMMMAEAYMMKGNMEQGNAEIQKALDKTQDKPELHANLLAAAGATFESVEDFANAEARYKESLRALPNQFLANFGLGKMLYNRAVDKLGAVNNVPLDDETGLADKYTEESKDFFRQSIPYFKDAITFIENMSAEEQSHNRNNLSQCLNALKTVYARLEMYDELKPINAKLEQLIKSANQ